jgi:hypothetical protein
MATKKKSDDAYEDELEKLPTTAEDEGVRTDAPEPLVGPTGGTTPYPTGTPDPVPAAGVPHNQILPANQPAVPNKL